MSCEIQGWKGKGQRSEAQSCDRKLDRRSSPSGRDSSDEEAVLTEHCVTYRRGEWA